MATETRADVSSAHNELPEDVQSELDRQLFHLKTLYEVSRQLLGKVEPEAILRDFLLMTMGNFGVAQGFVFVQDGSPPGKPLVMDLGIQESERPKLEKAASQVLVKGTPGCVFLREDTLAQFRSLETTIDLAIGFCVDESCCGLIAVGPKLTGEDYSSDDRDLISTLVNNLVVSLKNARYSEDLKNAYDELASLNRAKDKVIDHLSHELKTPISLLQASLAILEKKFAGALSNSWLPTMERAKRSVGRLGDMQSEVDDMMRYKDYRTVKLTHLLFDQCADLIEAFAAEELGETDIVRRIRERIDSLLQPRKSESVWLQPALLARQLLDGEAHLYSSREVHLITDFSTVRAVYLPEDVFLKVLGGLIRNAIENTPDGGRVEIVLRDRSMGVELIVRDTGVGIVQEQQQFVLGGFYHTQDTNLYSSKKRYEFGAGGKGGDLLRMQIFAERYRFKMEMISNRCRFIPSASDSCPGRITICSHCKSSEDCLGSGGTTFKVSFPSDSSRELV